MYVVTQWRLRKRIEVYEKRRGGYAGAVDEDLLFQHGACFSCSVQLRNYLVSSVKCTTQRQKLREQSYVKRVVRGEHLFPTRDILVTCKLLSRLLLTENYYIFAVFYQEILPWKWTFCFGLTLKLPRWGFSFLLLFFLRICWSWKHIKVVGQINIDIKIWSYIR